MIKEGESKKQNKKENTDTYNGRQTVTLAEYSRVAMELYMQQLKRAYFNIHNKRASYMKDTFPFRKAD